MKTAIVYCSKHKGNTKKLLDAIAEKYSIDLFNARHIKQIDLSDYDLIGFASGVYCEKVHKSVVRIERECLPKSKHVFFIYTCGSVADKYIIPLIKSAEEKLAGIEGVYACTGCYKLLPFTKEKNKGHPTTDEIQGAVSFYQSIINNLTDVG